MFCIRIFLIGLFSFGLSLSCFESVFAASVTRVDGKKRFVTIDEGKSSGIRKRTRICFIAPNGRKIVCGSVVKAGKNSAKVRVKNKKKLRKIKKGYTADIMGGGGRGKSRGKFMSLKGVATPAIISQSTYNKVVYAAPDTDNDTDTVETLWDSSEAAGSALFSVGAEIELLKMGIAVGVRAVRKFSDFKAESDYSKANANQFVLSTLTASSLGFYLDYYFMKPKPKKKGLKVGAGIDVDMSTLNLTVVQQEDEVEATTDIYTISSTLTVISLRVPLIFDVPLGAAGINVGVNLLIPISGDTPAMTADANDANTARYPGANDEEKTAFTQTDLLKSIGHSKNSFGAEAVVGLYFNL